MCFLLKYKPDIPWSVSSSQCLSIRTNTNTSHPSIPCVTGGITHVLYGLWEKKKYKSLNEDFREGGSSEEKGHRYFFRNMHSKLFPFECAMRHVKAWDKVHFLSYIFFFLLCLRPHGSPSCSLKGNSCYGTEQEGNGLKEFTWKFVVWKRVINLPGLMSVSFKLATASSIYNTLIISCKFTTSKNNFLRSAWS